MTQQTPPADLTGTAYLRLVLYAALIGIPAALVAAGFLALVHVVEDWLWTDLPDALGATEPPWYLVLGLPVVGALVVLAGAHAAARRRRSRAAARLNATRQRCRTPPGVALAAFGTLAFGAVLGPEAPLIALGSVVGMVVVKFVKVGKAGTAVLSTGRFVLGGLGAVRWTAGRRHPADRGVGRARCGRHPAAAAGAGRRGRRLPDLHRDGQLGRPERHRAGGAGPAAVHRRARQGPAGLLGRRDRRGSGHRGHPPGRAAVAALDRPPRPAACRCRCCSSVAARRGPARAGRPWSGRQLAGRAVLRPVVPAGARRAAHRRRSC